MAVAIIGLIYGTALATLEKGSENYKAEKKKIYDQHYIEYLQGIIQLQDSIIKANEYEPILNLNIKCGNIK